MVNLMRSHTGFIIIHSRLLVHSLIKY
ncbi:transcriptional regulator [Staphylococcus phage JPL-50]|uniref:Transcriptional regulator n=1 Tax=Staphylococcus phage JPL-50 TaxID=2851077 RepID=A0A8F3HNJ6_9CAUD|nr:transcriptional regulator [Staphylococcus phage JPL-50]QWY14503.1 transcriptional regulator [Staphylococcus phage JPL-50]